MQDTAPGRLTRGRPGRRPSPARSSTSSSRRTPCPRSTTPSSSTIELDGDGPARSPPRWPSRSARAGCAASACSRPTAWCAARRCATSAGASRSRSATPCSATSSTCSASRSTPTTSEGVDDYWEIHRNAPAFDQLEPQVLDVRDRDQGHRPARALRAGRQDRPLRRGRRGQDRHHPGDDPPGGPAARWRLGLRRRGGADP